MGRKGVEQRLGTDHIDHTAGRTAAIQGRLRAAQHFDAFQIVESRIGDVGGGQEDVVVVDGDARFGVVTDGGDADTADLEIRSGEVAFGVADAGRGELQVFELGDLVGLQVLGRIRADGDRDGLDIFALLLGGNDHLFNLGEGWRRECGRQEQCRDKSCGPDGPYAYD